MIYKPMRLQYKATFDIYRPDESCSQSGQLLADVLDALYNYVQINTPLRLTRTAFASHSFVAADDNRCRISIASIQMTKGSTYPLLWALDMVRRDFENPKRTWITSIGIRQDSEDVLKLYFSLWHIDNLSGYLAFMKPPVRCVPDLLRNLMADNRFLCCTGGFIMPTDPIELHADTMQLFMDILNDPMRSIPLIALCCPDVIHPTGLNVRLQGNAIIFFSAEPEPILDLNSELPPDMRVDLDGLRVYLPKNAEMLYQHHPQFNIHTILEAGSKNVVAYMAQAYSESFRSDEWRNFVTVDQILKMRAEQKVEELEALRARQAKTIENQKMTIGKLSDDMSRHSPHAVPGDELLALCLAENEALTHGVRDIIRRISEEVRFVPSLKDDSPLFELEKTIAAFQYVRRATTNT